MIVATSTPIKWKIGANLIQWYQGTKFSHVLIIYEDLVFQASHGYVNCWHIDNFMAENKIVNFYEVPEVAVDMDFVHKQLGKEYSTMQVFLLPIIKLIENKYKGNGDQKFICSEFVGKALKLDWVDDLTLPIEIDKYLRETYGET